ncbi:type IV conjugative transfer system protein TraL [Pseudorhodoferax soli]|uniref:Conjugal transfer pilus assembly protein TraL n=1 Tax=Pseudorhodoferax soli TaxID=545864 RepID=A0A368XAW1_9BURK|nr:type IV conjugative transfer system protein TraL [Pseudorhodoferax soli]RCW65102.1 conjugal transfer pilus assembly protein TraL [Pseudorhodoferax soli]
MQADTYIPRRLDDSWKIGFWDIDVAAPVLFMFFVGYLTSHKGAFALCVAGGIALSRWIARLKVDKHPAFATHWLYWHLPTSPASSMQATPPSHVRRMLG